MSKEQSLNLIKWQETINRLTNVLRVNTFMLSPQGEVLIAPRDGVLGGEFLMGHKLGFDFFKSGINPLDNFDLHGDYLESTHRYNLHSFALPVYSYNQQVVAYLVLSPIILNSWLPLEEYHRLAGEYGVSEVDLLDAIHEIRVVSQKMMLSILDLVNGVIADDWQLNLKNYQFEQLRKHENDLNSDVTGKHDYLLKKILEVAMGMANAECGSIMVFDKARQELHIRATKGLREDFKRSSQKLGEGISGIVAEEKKPVVISGKESSNNRIAHLLRRSDIKKAWVLPLVVNNRVLGVLNLHTRKNETAAQPDEIIESYKPLAHLLSNVI